MRFNFQRFINPLIKAFIIISFLALTACGGGGAGSGGGSSDGGTTIDATPPTILSTTPNSGATGIALNSSISIQFSEALDPASTGSGSVTVKLGASSVSGSVSYDNATRTITFDPASDFSTSTSYTVTISGNITDIAKNKLGSDSVFSFTSGTAADTTPPTVSSVVPVNSATGIELNANITITFSESMNSSTINSTNICLMDGAVEVASVVIYTAGTNTATINPNVDLDFYKNYNVVVKTGVKDIAGNALAVQYTSTFRTKNDPTPPTVTGKLPAANATNVAAGTNITITFSKSMDSSTINNTNITVLKKSNSAVIAGVMTYDDPSKTATFNPSSDLENNGITYVVTVTTSVKDFYGIAIAANYSWEFTTTDGTGPSVSSYTPANSSTNQSVLPDLTITFSEPMDTSTLNTNNITIKDAGNNDVEGTFNYNTTTMTATFVPSYNFNYSTTYTVTVGTNVEDANHNNLISSTSWSFTTKTRHWTIIYYGDGDCNLEAAIMNDIAEMKIGYVDDQGIDVIALVDRHPSDSSASGYSGDSSTLGSNFSDARLFRITNGKAQRISGSTQFPEITTTSTFEANVGDANTLKKFVQFCKANYAATNYALILSNHGGGAKSKTKGSSSKKMGYKDIAYDETSDDDFLYTAEITDVLTSGESINLLGFDACLMSAIEVAYQYRTGNGGFNASILIASAPTETANGWQYTNIFARLKSGGGNNGTADTTLGGNELYYNPATLTAQQLGAIIVEEQRDSTTTMTDQSLSCLDLSYAASVKNAVDTMGVNLAADSNAKANLDALRRTGHTALILHYFDDAYTDDISGAYGLSGYFEWMMYPYFDLYNLADAISSSSSFSSTIQTNAASVKTAVNNLVLYSYANSDFTGFVSNASGVHIFYPYGDDIMYVDTDGDGTQDTNIIHWYYQDWYNALDISGEYTGAPLGKLLWCIDNKTATTSDVGNWFELLDKWYDVSNTAAGGYNYYQW